VDPVSRREFWEILFDSKKQGTTVVVSTPYMEEAQQCEELLFLHHGKIIRQGTPEKLPAEYPFPLFSVEGQAEGILAYPQSGKMPEGIAMIYPSEGSLHVAAKKKDSSSEDVLSAVKSVLPETLMIRKIEPKIEDLFIYLLSNVA
jgi:ABC-2 type transport system ATP-binding protein